jgi:hypothetical protein
VGIVVLFVKTSANIGIRTISFIDTEIWMYCWSRIKKYNLLYFSSLFSKQSDTHKFAWNEVNEFLFIHPNPNVCTWLSLNLKSYITSSYFTNIVSMDSIQSQKMILQFELDFESWIIDQCLAHFKFINKNKLEIGIKHFSHGLDWNEVWNK